MAGATAGLLAGAPSGATAADRYALQGGCYDVASSGGGAEQVRLQATALSRYLLYGRDGTFLTASGDRLGPQPAPSDAADFAVVEDDGDRYKLTPKAGGGPRTATLTPADGCATFPEAGLQADGIPSKHAGVVVVRQGPGQPHRG